MVAIRVGAFNCSRPALQWLGPNLFALMHELHYHRRNGDFVRLPLLIRDGHVLGMTTDGGSKPTITQWLIGTSIDEGLLAYITHDGLYRLRFVYRAGLLTPIDRAEADLILLEAMQDCGMSTLACDTIYSAVRVGGASHWHNQEPLNLDAVTVQNTGPDFAVLSILAVPSFNNEATEIAARRLSYAL